MKVRKIAIAACFASALTMVSAPASAAAYLIGGKWYFFSLDYDATLKKVTGKELNAVITVTSDVGITLSQVQCGNPQGHLLDPGEGPQLSGTGTSPPVGINDVEKSDRSKSTFKKTVQVELPLPPGVNPCDSPANSINGDWQTLYWQKSTCDRGIETATGVKCYSDLAYRNANDFNNLYYVTGSLKGTRVGNNGDWTFVYLPTAFSYTSTVKVGGTPTSFVTGQCSFGNNNDPGADNTQPYSLKNPPIAGWANARTLYECQEAAAVPLP